MKSWLHVTDTGVNVLEILEVVSQGGSCLEIRRRFPAVSRQDLAHAAKAILDYLVTHIPADMVRCSAPILEKPRCVPFHDSLPWTDGEDEELRRLTRYRFRISVVARLLRRSEPVVRNRLTQLHRRPRPFRT